MSWHKKGGGQTGLQCSRDSPFINSSILKICFLEGWGRGSVKISSMPGFSFHDRNTNVERSSLYDDEMKWCSLDILFLPVPSLSVPSRSRMALPKFQLVIRVFQASYGGGGGDRHWKLLLIVGRPAQCDFLFKPPGLPVARAIIPGATPTRMICDEEIARSSVPKLIFDCCGTKLALCESDSAVPAPLLRWWCRAWYSDIVCDFRARLIRKRRELPRGEKSLHSQCGPFNKSAFNLPFPVLRRKNKFLWKFFVYSAALSDAASPPLPHLGREKVELIESCARRAVFVRLFMHSVFPRLMFDVELATQRILRVRRAGEGAADGIVPTFCKRIHAECIYVCCTLIKNHRNRTSCAYSEEFKI